MKWAAVGIPDPQTPIGAKGIGEPAICAGAAAAICALTRQSATTTCAGLRQHQA